jgi:hypothetical protein
MRLLASTLDDAGPRPWIWAVLAGLVLGGVLVGHALLMIARALPEEVRAEAVAAVRRRPRLAAVTLGVAAWTLVFALYSLAYPGGAALLGIGAARPAASVAPRAASSTAWPGMGTGLTATDLLPPSLSGVASPTSDAAAGPDGTADAHGTTTTTTARPGAPAPTPAPAPSPSPTPCQQVAALAGVDVGAACKSVAPQRSGP